MVAPVEEWIATAHKAGVPVILDASQSVAHLPIDVRALNVDFMGFSSHKMFGPNGVGVLYVRRDRFESSGSATWAAAWSPCTPKTASRRCEAPFRYEAGTPNIEGVIGLGAAVDYLRGVGMQAIAAHVSYARRANDAPASPSSRTRRCSGRSARERIALATVSLPLPSMRQQDIARLLADAHGIFVSGGFHCAHVLHHRLRLDGTLRASAQIFNDSGDIEALLNALRDL